MKKIKSLKKHWPLIRKKLKFRYPDLSDADLNFKGENEDDFLKNLQIKIGKTRKELMTEINALALEV